MNAKCAGRWIVAAALLGGAAGFGPVARADTSISGVYQVQATNSACAFRSASCVLTFKRTPTANAIAAHSVSCSMKLDYEAAFITPPAAFSSMVLSTGRNGESVFLLPQLTDFRSTGGNSSGQVAGMFYFTANYNGTFYISPGVIPTVTLTLDAVQVSGFSFGSITCTISGELIAS